MNSTKQIHAKVRIRTQTCGEWKKREGYHAKLTTNDKYSRQKLEIDKRKWNTPDGRVEATDKHQI